MSTKDDGVDSSGRDPGVDSPPTETKLIPPVSLNPFKG